LDPLTTARSMHTLLKKPLKSENDTYETLPNYRNFSADLIFKLARATFQRDNFIALLVAPENKGDSQTQSIYAQKTKIFVREHRPGGEVVRNRV